LRLDVKVVGPVAKIKVDQTSGTAPLTVNFDSSESTGNISSYSWDFGDQTGTSTEPNPTYIYQAKGDYTVTLTVSGDGKTDDDTIQINVTAIDPPTASFSATPSVDVPLAVTFDSSASTGEISSYTWDFGDNTEPSTEANPSHTFDHSGTFTVTLTVNGPGGSDSFASTIQAGGDSNCGWTPKTGLKYSMVAFGKIYQNDVETDWTDQYMIAAFGPGGESDCRALKTVGDMGGKTMPGMYYLTITSDNEDEQITFKICEKNGQKALDIEQNISFKNQNTLESLRLDVVKLIASFTPSKTSGSAPLTVSFDSSHSKGEITYYSWEFGDQTSTSSEANPEHTFNTPGDYTVKLTIGNDNNETDSTTQIIKVLPYNYHSADYNPQDYAINLSELLRVIQFYNFDKQGGGGAYHCDTRETNAYGYEDGFRPGLGNPDTDHECTPHSSDYLHKVKHPGREVTNHPHDWIIDLDELLRLIQIYNSKCATQYEVDSTTEDGFKVLDCN
jgi:PKD repeat protein